jgi:hypothetical protein
MREPAASIQRDELFQDVMLSMAALLLRQSGQRQIGCL